MTSEIVQKNHPVLRKKAKAIKASDILSPSTQKDIENMKQALATQYDGVALAAPQIAISKRIFVINPEVFNMAKYKGEKETVFINPQIIKISKDTKKMEEGCLSVRPMYGKVKRASRATVEAFNEKGEKFIMEGRGLLAQIFQHEIDHLEGVLFTDKAEDLREMPLEEEYA